jgi:L-asparaginase II
MTSSPEKADDPVLVEATRGEMVESRHRGACAVTDADGTIILAIGDIARPAYARSAIKPLQALPLIESGAADAFQLGAGEIALACASHRGEPMHVAAVSAWLARIGLGPGDLECGTHAPTDPAAAQALYRAGASPSPLHNNCSGKHAGFLTTARFFGEGVRGYIAAAHPVQQRVEAVLAAMTGLDLSAAPRGTDGCGIPVIGMPLSGLARAMARLATPARLPEKRGAAGRRILEAMAAEPLMVAGTGTFVSAVLATTRGSALVKNGAEGMFCAALPAQGLGIALKIADGAGRAAEVAMGAVLRRLGALDAAQLKALARFLAPDITNVAGKAVGRLRSTLGGI